MNRNFEDPNHEYFTEPVTALKTTDELINQDLDFINNRLEKEHPVNHSEPKIKGTAWLKEIREEGNQSVSFMNTTNTNLSESIFNTTVSNLNMTENDTRRKKVKYVK